MKKKANAPDGECDFPGCTARMDFQKHDKPLPGWAHVVMNRYVAADRRMKTTGEMVQSVTLLLCPDCTIAFAKRRMHLPGSTPPAKFRRVIIESPYAGRSEEETERNLRFLRASMRDALLRGDAPYASHGLYTQPGVFDDKKPEERKLGIEAGFTWMEAAEASVIYEDLGISGGMQLGLERAAQLGKPIERRKLKWKG